MPALTQAYKITLDSSQPYFVYERLALAARVYTVYQVPYGYNYCLRRIVARWPLRNVLAGVIRDALLVEVVHTAANLRRQNDALPLTLITSPAGESEYPATEPSAPLGLSASAASLQSTKFLNYVAVFGDAIRLEIVPEAGTGAKCPEFVDVVLMGYLLPESSLAMWGSAG